MFFANVKTNGFKSIDAFVLFRFGEVIAKQLKVVVSNSIGKMKPLPLFVYEHVIFSHIKFLLQLVKRPRDLGGLVGECCTTLEREISVLILARFLRLAQCGVAL